MLPLVGPEGHMETWAKHVLFYFIYLNFCIVYKGILENSHKSGKIWEYKSSCESVKSNFQHLMANAVHTHGYHSSISCL